MEHQTLTDHRAAAIGRRHAELLQLVAAAEIQSWRRRLLQGNYVKWRGRGKLELTNGQICLSTSFLVTFASIREYKGRDAKMIVISNCSYFHLK